MAGKNAAKKSAGEKADQGEPKFPYTTEPNALRRLLAEIPKRPKPPKLTFPTLKAWSVSRNQNAISAIRVLKKVGLLAESGEPTEFYIGFMKTGTGPAVLGQRVKEVYRVFFESTVAPQNESNDELKKLFNIHSGGSGDVLRLQAQTFKILAEFSSFDAAPASPDAQGQGTGAGNDAGRPGQDGARIPPVQLDLHIHLPENKTARDYEAIIQDIAKYIYGRDIERT